MKKITPSDIRAAIVEEALRRKEKKQLYESANLAEGWNGEFKNKKINTGVLVYILDFTLR